MPSAPKTSRPAICLVAASPEGSPEASSCEASAAGVQRLCPCGPQVSSALSPCQLEHCVGVPALWAGMLCGPRVQGASMMGQVKRRAKTAPARVS